MNKPGSGMFCGLFRCRPLRKRQPTPAHAKDASQDADASGDLPSNKKGGQTHVIVQTLPDNLEIEAA